MSAEFFSRIGRFLFRGFPAGTALAIFISFPLWAEDDFKASDFSGAMVYTGREGSLLSLEIPLEVYQGILRPDQGDIRIFDSRGLPVSFVIRDRPVESFTPPPEETPFFVWDGGTEILPSGTDIEINTAGGVVRIKNQTVSGSPPVYLADLSAPACAPSSLKVEFEAREHNFNTSVTMHSSGDLSNWNSFDKKQVLASFGGTVMDTLELPGAGERYVLLTFDRDAPRPVSMTALFNLRERDAEYHEVTVKGEKSADGKKISYNTGSRYPAETIDFILEEADSIRVNVKNRPRETGEWNTAARGTLYRYNSAGAPVKNPPFALGGVSSRVPFWELEAAGELPFSAAPDMTLRWKKRELVFPARGRGPWTLAYGNAACRPLDSPERLSLDAEAEPEAAVFTGEKRYESRGLSFPEESDYRPYFLWAFLGAAVIILSILAYTIARSMRKQN